MRRTPENTDAGAARIRFGIGAGALVVLLVAGSLAFEPRISELGVLGYVDRYALFRAVAAIGFGLPGAVVVALRPRHREGWLLLAIGFVEGVSVMGESYGLVGVHDPGAPLPAADWALWVSTGWLWAPAYLLIPTLFLLLFPDGHLPSPRWWPAAVVAGTAVAASAIGWAVLPAADTDVAVLPPGYAFPVPASPALASTALAISLILALVGTVAGLASLVVRFRRAIGAERQQVKWVLVAAITMVPLLAAGLADLPFAPILAAAAMIPLPLAVAVAVTQHRLWDIDLILGRSLVLAALTATVLVVYGLCVLVLGRALGSRTGAPLIATALVAVGIQPLHTRVRRRVNHLVFGDRNDPGQALRRLGSQLREAGAPNDVLDEVCRAIARALRLQYVAISTGERVVAASGEPAPILEEVPLGHGGVVVGALLLGTGPGDRVRPGDRRMLEELAPHVAVVVRSDRLAKDLARSHQQRLAARDQERERLRRDLHDGLGPTLAALALKVDRGRLTVGREPEAAPPLLDEVAVGIRDAVRTVRAIVDDLQPPPIGELGLAGALHELGRTFTGDLVVAANVPETLPPLPRAVELAVYRIAAEALSNAARHSGATHCSIEVRIDEEIELRIEDNGRGMPPALSEGVGLPSMRSRAHQLGGRVEVARPTSGGTTVTATLPIALALAEDRDE